jgi:hypothetical protein
MRGWVSTVGEVIGIGLVTTGLWFIFPPAALIFAGLSIGFISFWQEKR